MSVKELDRLQLLGRVIERRLTQRQAAAQLGLNLRQVERSRETLRLWMIDAGFWIPRVQRRGRAYQPRHRRSEPFVVKLLGDG